MSWSYSGDPGATPLDLARFLIRDTESDDQLLQNEELQFLIDTWGDAYEAARNAALTLAAKFTRQSVQSKSVGDLSISESFAGKAGEYRELAQSIADIRMRLAPPGPWVAPGNLVPTERRQPLDQTDFRLGRFDNRAF
jgi:nucleotidyltransferase/DNA polymerase involved in DNA repair